MKCQACTHQEEVHAESGCRVTGCPCVAFEGKPRQLPAWVGEHLGRGHVVVLAPPGISPAELSLELIQFGISPFGSSVRVHGLEP